MKLRWAAILMLALAPAALFAAEGTFDKTLSVNGAANLTIESFVTTAPYVGIFTSTDDYSGAHLTGAVVPRQLIGTFSKEVKICKHCIIGTVSTIMPGVTLEEGTAVAAHSFFKSSFGPLTIVGGVPAREIGKRGDNFLTLEKKINE